MNVKEISVSVEKTLLREFGNINIHVSDHGDTFKLVITEHRKTAVDQLLQEQRYVDYSETILEQYSGPEWKLPSDPHSRVIEYKGRQLQYSVIRFAIMKLLIEANGHPVSFSDIALAGWGEYVYKGIIEKQVYPLNRFLTQNDIPKVVRYSKERMFLGEEKKTLVNPACVPEISIHEYEQIHAFANEFARVM